MFDKILPSPVTALARSVDVACVILRGFGTAGRPRARIDARVDTGVCGLVDLAAGEAGVVDLAPGLSLHALQAPTPDVVLRHA